MTWISLVCLLAISSSALARSVSYGSYGASSFPQVSSMNLVRDFPTQSTLIRPVVEEEKPREVETLPTGYGQYAAQSMIRKPLVQFDQSYNKVSLPAPRSFASPAQLLQEQQQKLKQLIDESTVLTEADNLCRGQRPETVIPLDNGRRFVVCIDESKGHEQVCPRGLLYHPESRRCERKLGPLENPCSSSPCLNNGQCVQTDISSYKCQCTPGYDGEHCELDATVCQTQQPCGSSPDTRCQSFRWGAALQHICILQGGRAYGLTASQAQSSPCTGVDGTFPLAFSDKGFIMCSGEYMYIESCPGGTVWDDINKSCVWPDMQGLSFDEPKVPTYSTPSYSAPRSYTPSVQLDEPVKVPTYGGYSKPMTVPKFIQKDETTYGGYNTKPMTTPKFLIKDEITSSYDNKITMPVRQEDVVERPTFSYSQPTISKPIFTQPIRQQDFIRQPTSGY